MEHRQRRREKLFFLLFGGVIGIILLVIGGYQLMEFTESEAFCGRLCHEVMYPEYTAYQASPHSRVACSECHVGPGLGYLIKSKVENIPFMFATIFNTYDRPIQTPAETLRPAAETCEQCHRPERFTGDITRVCPCYKPDEQNTEKSDIMVFRVGSGELDTASDIHWHIAAKVWYLPLDEKLEEIGWVGVENNNGELTEYIDPERKTEITPEQIEDGKRLMDCMDCHNRPAHVFLSPEQLIDMALFQGKIDASLPFIKREGLKALDPANSSLEQAFAKVEAIKEFYNTSYPEVFKEKEPAIDAAIKELREIAKLTTFPNMKVDWDTYADYSDMNLGCFRCHGKLVATTGPLKFQVIDRDCTSCHYILAPTPAPE